LAEPALFVHLLFLAGCQTAQQRSAMTPPDHMAIILALRRV
jgi:uncharacterized lipoprotein YajG